jgi:hypothetical protein
LLHGLTVPPQYIAGDLLELMGQAGRHVPRIKAPSKLSPDKR